MKYFFDRILPKSIEFNFVDVDSELSLNLGRARLASATAFNLLQTNGNFSQQEVRSQFIQDGLTNISIPDKLPKDAKAKQEAKFWHDTLGTPGKLTDNQNSQKKKPGEPELTGSPKTPSTGGEGDVKKMASLTVKSATKNMNDTVSKVVTQLTPKVYEALQGVGEDELYLIKSTINNSLFEEEDILGLQEILKSVISNRQSLVSFKFDGLEDELKVLSGVDKDLSSYAKTLKSRINKGINPFIVNALAVMLNDVIVTDDVINNPPLEEIVSTLNLGIEKSLSDLVAVYVADEVENILQEIQTLQYMDNPV
jgi:hypothetical protein